MLTRPEGFALLLGLSLITFEETSKVITAESADHRDFRGYFCRRRPSCKKSRDKLNLTWLGSFRLLPSYLRINNDDLHDSDLEIDYYY